MTSGLFFSVSGLEMGMGEDDFNKREEGCRVIDGVGGGGKEEALPIKRDKQQALGVHQFLGFSCPFHPTLDYSVL